MSPPWRTVSGHQVAKREAVDSVEQLLHFWRWRRQRGQLTREVVHRQRVLIAGELILAHGLVEGTNAGERFVGCDGTEFGATRLAPWMRAANPRCARM
jgi:hypothetical protein